MKEREETIFISYAREDSDIASKLVLDLQHQGLSIWFDQQRLLPGQRWKDEVLNAIRSSTYFIFILSSKSVSKRGYVQRELREALEVLDEAPATDIFLIPVRVEECSPSDQRLQEIHWVDLFPSYDNGLSKLLRVFAHVGEEPTNLPALLTSDFRFQYKNKPSIDVKLAVPDDQTSKIIKVNCLIDYASSVSLIPEQYIRDLGSTLYYEVTRATGTFGDIRSLRRYFIDLIIGDIIFENFGVVSFNKSYCLIGNDVLSQFVVLIDGPNQQVRLWNHP